MIANQKNQLPPHADVAVHDAGPFHSDGHPGCMPIAGHVFDFDRFASLIFETHDTNGRIEKVLPGLDSPQMRERDREADRAVAAHVQHADIVEEDYSGNAALADLPVGTAARPNKYVEPR